MDLVTLVRAHGYRTGCEIGVWRGRTSFDLLDRCPKLNRLYMIDPWRLEYCQFPVPPDTPLPNRMPRGWYLNTMGEPRHDQSKLDQMAVDVRARVTESYPGRAVVLRMTSRAARPHIAWESLDFVYLDAIHLYDDVLDDLEGWWDRLSSGGVFAGDDWGGDLGEFPGVAQAVRTFTRPGSLGAGCEVHVEEGGLWWLCKV